MTIQDLLNSRLRNEVRENFTSPNIYFNCCLNFLIFFLLKIQRYVILPLHSMLSSRDQQAVFNV